MQGVSVQGAVLGVAVSTHGRTGDGPAWTPAGTIAVDEGGDVMTQMIPKSRSRKVNGYVKAMLALESVKRKRDARYERFVRALDQKRDRLAAEVETRRRALTGGQQAEARWILGAIPTVNAFKDGGVTYEVLGRRVQIARTSAQSVIT